MNALRPLSRFTLFTFLVLLLPFAANAASVRVLAVQGAIGPASADYLVRGLDKAIEHQARLVVIELDTPGGLDTSMRDIIQAILASPVPVATYVFPQGARAASAGTYILYASHIAAMAPATNLGAATPIELAPSGDKSAAPADDTRMRKVVHDAAAYIRGLAELRGRNAAWAERAVREAVSLPASEALKLNVVDLVATDLDDLLRQLNGRSVKLDGRTITLDTAHATVERVMPDWRSRLLAVIGDPGIAYILMLLGLYGLIYEFANPGMLFPGVVGGICLLLGLFAMQAMPISYAGLALMLLGIVLMISEAFVPSFGALGLGGIAAFILGSVMLIDTDLPGYGLPWMLIVPVALISALFSFFVASMALRARQRPVVTGAEELVGATGITLEAIEREGWARVHSERWRVRSTVPLPPGSTIRVRARHDLVLDVEPWQGE
ncbi:MAG: serine protease [Thiobacillus sp. 63-78]|uniref:NfeD family protein n=1 Tax=Thiobacillus sp. 63-78 TaxID=1895859 RepID=UPI000963EF60|nr:nodulation protein NfeD [Thiobacillus sp. 63-78]MBN8764202.1 nodulation protein NfeD [Thiobacillus sp.]MBN8774707.1 nodulation protein NfeD [Thiobacillus sp.]OJZ08502.1 MAG: serine protease [Thiobacillus sp. 63-78]